MTEQRTLESGKAWLLDRLERGAHPLDGVDPHAARTTIEELEGLDPKSWTTAWGSAAERFAAEAKSATDRQAERAARWQAYRLAFLARYPVPNHPSKQEAYARSRELFLEAAQLDDPPVEVYTVPFRGRAGEGDSVRFYLARPRAAERPPVVLAWAGIDTWKEEAYSRLANYRQQHVATLLVDMPGVGESPVLAGRDAERQWDPVFDWLASRDDLDAARCVALGMSFGGYWAMKLGYTHADRLRGVVNWGGGVHVTFTPEWQARSRNASSYLIDLMAARAGIFGGSTFEDYVARCQELSLLDQGLLDQPSAPMLLVNGKNDVQNSIDDIYLSLEHGRPKSARVFPGGHMGEGPVAQVIETWLLERLR